MRPYILSGHDSPITQVRYNREGDLIVSVSKKQGGSTCCLWYGDNGQLVGTYEGHNGTIWTCDITRDSKVLVTASADSSVRMWDVQTGQELWHFFKKPFTFRACAFSEGAAMLAVSADKFKADPPTIYLFHITQDIKSTSIEPCAVFPVKQEGLSSIRRFLWVETNMQLLAAGDDGCVRRFDVANGVELQCEKVHDGQITDMKLSQDGTHIITTSMDMTAKLLDSENLQILKKYQSQHPVNSADLHPHFLHVLLGGGQDASSVTTSGVEGGFEARFYHKVFQTEFALLRGHFSPITSLAYSPDGSSFVTGAHEGNLRVHHFDKDYHEQNFQYKVDTKSNKIGAF